MSQIAHLPSHLVNKIAAGEVIERPASVVKELMENSFDAGATRIDVEIAEGGKKLIQVRDNGSGINPDELPLAVASHATSKIANDEDLFRINTFGFRGEALASIASVSQLEIISRSPQAGEGARLEIAGGDQQSVSPAAALAGTQIAIRNLFFNIPARRKFLRAINTEWGHIAEQFVRLAIAHCNVHLTLTHNGRKVHDLPADQSLRERIERLFSQELAQSLISIRRAEGDIEISGLIAPPQHSRANAQWQYILLNNRHIRDRIISHALREGYRGLMEIHRYPIVFLFLKIAPDRVDVNVHPATSEVRFYDSNVVHSQVLAAIRDRLLSSDLRPQVTLNAPDQTQSPQQDGNQQQRVRQAIADFFQKTPPTSNSLTNPDSQGGAFDPLTNPDR
ncbi:MAG: DNA mismatch repair endonuclease MutL, partial [Planctomycetes bacterium]|nr:DNA mismatch repair endonuclease MutL [Planctomycetota bacterium]